MKALQVLLLTGLFVLSSAAQSSLTSRDWIAGGDNLLTFDDQSNYEWLDLTHTAGLSYAQVQGQLAPGGSFAGFQVASTAQVQSLFQSGGWTGGWGVNVPNQLSTYQQATSIIELLGNTYGTMFPGWIISAGFIADTPPGTNNVAYLVARNETDFPLSSAAGISLFPAGQSSPELATYLYREVAAPVPEPETYALMLAGLGLLAAARRLRQTLYARPRALGKAIRDLNIRID